MFTDKKILIYLHRRRLSTNTLIRHFQCLFVKQIIIIHVELFFRQTLSLGISDWRNICSFEITQGSITMHLLQLCRTLENTRTWPHYKWLGFAAQHFGWWDRERYNLIRVHFASWNSQMYRWFVCVVQNHIRITTPDKQFLYKQTAFIQPDKNRRSGVSDFFFSL